MAADRIRYHVVNTSGNYITGGECVVRAEPCIPRFKIMIESKVRYTRLAWALGLEGQVIEGEVIPIILEVEVDDLDHCRAAGT